MSNYLLFIAGNDIDHYYEVENFLQAGDACLTKYLGSKVGGCVLNAASVAAMLGSDSKVLDILKKDSKDTDTIIETLKQYQVDTSRIILDENAENGTCLIMKKNDEKCIFVLQPKRPYYTENQELTNLLNNAKYIYSLAETLKISFSSFETIQTAKQHGAKLILDASSQYTNENDKMVLLNYADGFFMNKASYTRLTKKCDFDPITHMLEQGLEFGVVTDGDNGGICYTQNKTIKYKAKKINKVIDSTGAGDTFAACFLHFLAKGTSIEKTLEYAIANSAYACLHEGGNTGAISEKELFTFMKES